MTKKLILLALWTVPWVARSPEWAPATGAALQAAGENRKELTRALSEVAPEQREGMQFLIDHMPPVDLIQLKADFLLAHVNRFYQVMKVVPWSKDVPPEIFFNDVLPYASLNESRDNSRAKLAEIATPLISGCRTPGEAALLLNQKLFDIVKVKYSTQRKKPDQSALESMESGVATCTGLSILLVEACRSVGIPARVVGTPLWTNLSGNHTWVEIWDGTWHFVGAAEPDPKGLDQGWFKNSAATADNHKVEHRIYASSFKRTGIAFPLVWDPSIKWVSAVNVTERYSGMALPADGKVKLLVKVLDKPNGIRLSTQVGVVDAADPTQKFYGTSRNDTADLNNILTFSLLPNHTYTITASDASVIVKRQVTATQEAEQTITLTLTN